MMTDAADTLPADAPDGAAPTPSFAAFADWQIARAERERTDGWTAETQRRFLELLSQGRTVRDSCRTVGMSMNSAYVLRRSARGAGFALGWQAAVLLAREHLADTMLEHAMNDTLETTTHADGTSSTRERYDNRLCMYMLTRLDRLADSATGAADHAAARLVAAEFEPFLDLVAQQGGPARTGLFLARRLAAEDMDGAADDLAPVRALARADAWLRTHQDAAEGVAIADLDPAQRAGWTADQWARAEAAGLVQFAPPPARDERNLRNLNDADNPDGDRVWWDSMVEEWRTDFPPDELFWGKETGAYGEEGYSRTLSDDELEIIEAPIREALEEQRAREANLRDAWFAAEAEGGALLSDPPLEGDMAGIRPDGGAWPPHPSAAAPLPPSPTGGEGEDAPTSLSPCGRGKGPAAAGGGKGEGDGCSTAHARSTPKRKRNAAPHHPKTPAKSVTSSPRNKSRKRLAPSQQPSAPLHNAAIAPT